MEESRHPKIAELRKFMLNRPSKAVLAPVAEGFGALAAALSKPFVPREVGYVQVDSGQKSRKVRNHMLRSPFKSVIARTAIFAIVLSIGIAFVSAGMDPSASAQQTTTDPCKQDSSTTPVTVTCSYDENDTAAVANFSAMDPEGESIAWSLSGDDAADFSITGGVLAFKKSPNYEAPSDRADSNDAGGTDNAYKVMVVATEVRAPGSLDLAQSTKIAVTVNVQNVEEDPTFTLNRLQVRAGVTAATITATVTDPDTRDADGNTVEISPTYAWFVPKVSRPVLDNEDHWSAAPGSGADGATYTSHATDAGKYLRVVASYTDRAGKADKAYARSAYPVAAPLPSGNTNNPPQIPGNIPDPATFTVREDAAVGTVVGSVRGSDNDSGDILSHTLAAGGDSDKFDIDLATGRITVDAKLNFEADGGTSHSITVNVHDPSGANVNRTVNITVSDVNDAPNNAAETSPNRTVAENHALTGNSPTILGVYTVTAGTDPDASDGISAITLSLGGTDASLFSLTKVTDSDAYNLAFKKSPNYESPADADGNNQYHVTVITTDNESASSERALVITVTNEDEDGEVVLSTTQPAIGQAVTATLTDPDMNISERKWQWKRASSDAGPFINIAGATSATYTPVKTVKDDPVTSENEAVDGDEGDYLQVVVTYVDNASDDVHAPAATPPTFRTRTIEKVSDNAVREAPDVNQAPSFATGITREVPEDAAADAKVGGPVEATDPDAGDELTYEITGGADMGSFEISSAGQITVKSGTKFNYEGSQTSYTVVVTATDPFGLTATTTVTITVKDVNEDPEVTAPGAPCKQNASTKAVTCDYDENGTAAVGTFSATDPEGENIAWSLTSADAADFDITGGVLSFKKSPNYESPADANTDNAYVVTVVATEVRAPGSLDLANDTEIAVTVTVKNVEEDPTFTLNRLQVRAGVSAATITAEVKDPDDRDPPADAETITINYKWYVPKVSRPVLDNDDHWADATGTGAGTSVYAAAEADAGKYLRVVATYTDKAGKADKAYAKSAYPVAAPLAQGTTNNPPQIPSNIPDPAVFTVREDAVVGTVVGTVRGSDNDSGDILSHTLSGANASTFDIDPATGRITVDGALDHETNATLTFNVDVHDPSGGTVQRTVNITVSDVNDAPVGATQGDTVNHTVAENHLLADDPDTDPVETGTVLSTYQVTNNTDPDDTDGISAITLSLGGTDASLFSLTDTTNLGGTAGDNIYELGFKKSPNYESPADADGNNKYHVTVITADNEGATHERPLVITVTNEDEDGKVVLSTTQPAIGRAVTATLTDPDMNISEVKWQWKRASSSAGSFLPIPGATSATYTPVKTVKDDPVTTENEGVDGDEGDYLQVVVTYVDNASAAVHAPNANPPTFRTRTIEKVSDNAVREAPDVNQAPSFPTGITREVPEDAAADAKVGGPVTANDPDGDALTYRISGGADMGSFNIGSTTAQITVKSGTKFNYEGTQTTYTVEVTATDPFGLSASTTVTITVTDVNEAPTLVLQPGGTTPPGQGVVGGRATVNVVEGTTAVGTYTTEIASPTWSLSGADAGDFSITSGGALSFRTAPDYESPADANRDNTYTVTVVASNGGGTSATLVVNVTVTNDPSDDGSTFDPLTYDTDNSGSIERSEVIQAIRDYFADHHQPG